LGNLYYKFGHSFAAIFISQQGICFFSEGFFKKEDKKRDTQEIPDKNKARSVLAFYPPKRI